MSSDGSGAPPPGEPVPVLSRSAFLRVVLTRGSVGLVSFGAGFGIDAIWARLVRGGRLERSEYRRFVVGGLRIHHSIVGYAAVVLGLAYRSWILVPLGVGIILGHGRRDRYGFLERVGAP